jgi:D-alanyl-D-alanine carboxypeptidase
MMRQSELGPVWGHGGYMPGYLSAMAYYPEHGLAVAVQMNRDVGVKFDATGALLDSVAPELLAK